LVWPPSSNPVGQVEHDSREVPGLGHSEQNPRNIQIMLTHYPNVLLLDDLRSGLGDAAFYEISLNLELLLRAQVHHGVER
jgi:hypothetical protein